jgi:hypothetical protein
MTSVELMRLFSWNRFTPVSFLFERSVLDEIGLFNERLPVIGDWEFNLRFLTTYEIAVLPKYLAFWHQRPKLKSGYGNSVHAEEDLHRKYRALLTNKWIRESMKKGVTDFGSMYAAALLQEELVLSGRNNILYYVKRLYVKLRKWMNRAEA